MTPNTVPAADDRDLPLALADGVSNGFLAGGMLHLYFSSAAPARDGRGTRRIVTAKVAMTMGGFVELYGHLGRLAAYLESQGVLKRLAEGTTLRQ